MDLRRQQLALWRLEQRIKGAAVYCQQTGRIARNSAIAASLAAAISTAPAIADQYRAEIAEAQTIAADIRAPEELYRLAEIVSQVHVRLESGLPPETRLLTRRADGLPKEKPPAFLESVRSLLGVG